AFERAKEYEKHRHELLHGGDEAVVDGGNGREEHSGGEGGNVVACNGHGRGVREGGNVGGNGRETDRGQRRQNHSMLERSTGVVGVTKATSGPEAITKEWSFLRRAPGTGRTPLRGTSAPAGPVQIGPSPALLKENIDVLRTMIKELDNQGQEKVTHEESAELVGELSDESFSRRSGRGISKSHRSVRSEARSRSKSKSVKSKPRSVRASRRKSSSVLGYDTVYDSGLEDLSMPYRQTKPMPFTSRITRFRYHRRAKLSRNVRVYEGNKDPEDHLNPTKIHGIKRKPNEGLQAFMEHFKVESAHIKGVPPVLRIYVFMHGHGHPELGKKLNDKISKTVDEMWERVRAFIRRETAPDTIEVIRSTRWEKSDGKSSWSENQNRSRNIEILAIDNVNFHPPPLMVGTPKKRNMNKFRDYHQDRGHNTNDRYHLKKQIEEAVALGRLAHIVKDIRQSGQKSKGSSKGKEKVINMASRLEGYVDSVVKSPSLYNALLGRTGMRSLGAVASTIHSMIKFLTSNGVATIATIRKTLREWRQIKEAQALSRHARRPGKEPMPLGDMEERRLLDKGKKLPKSIVEEKIVYKCFLDAYKGYHQIRMTNKDEEKTTFYTEEGVFYDTKMHFGLKNAEATYQRLVHSAFKEQIRANLEAYVDDMMQSLSGKLEALNRFLSKSVERSLPFLDTLKKCTNKKDFRWTEAVEAAFLEMKKLVSELPTLTTLKKGKTLMMYLAAANEAVSAVLLTERDGRRMPIHYVSRSLHRAEVNYAPVEKLALALVHTARWLRRYFQAHPIKVITDSPIGQVLNNSGASGRLAKWAIKLGAYGITYVPRVVVKGQVLADFLADTSTKVNATAEVASTLRVDDIPESLNVRKNLTSYPRAWRLYTDGALNNEGSELISS
nr:reverse transcriptase domain-containing protein [Tanacetum cinerariifolium]